MLQTHPLETPEILWEVSKYVSWRTLFACVRVSMAWYKTFLPQIWKDIELTKDKLPPGAIHGYMYNRLVKTLRIRCALKKKQSRLILPNLASLTVENASWDENLFKLVGNHPTLTHLDLGRDIGTHSTRFLGILVGLHRLKDLKIMGLEVNEDNVDTFWQLCAQLERLEISFQQISAQDRQQSMEFPLMRELRVNVFPVDSVPWIQDFMQRCPGLRSFGSFNQKSNRLFIPRIAPLVSAGTWPHLQSIALWTASTDGEDVANIVAGCKIRAVDIVGGQPWVCLKLKVLKLGIYADDSTISQIQPLVFDQLSRLTQLQELHVHCRETEGMLDLRLESGLGRLSTLRSLRLLNFGVSTMQMIQQPEVDWMLKHWKSLERIHRKPNALNPTLDTALKMKLRHHGIAVSL
ncbi:MAG: hypothetical protein J3Q66DRAFT_415356 [Benniella sp.]|nr:MAG: hypothetical protein J3Q66DRAFT_415356 [Benniella sp.]